VSRPLPARLRGGGAAATRLCRPSRSGVKGKYPPGRSVRRKGDRSCTVGAQRRPASLPWMYPAPPVDRLELLPSSDAVDPLAAGMVLLDVSMFGDFRLDPIRLSPARPDPH